MQRHGIGTRLSPRDLCERAVENGIEHLVATTLHENRAARVLLRRIGFRTRSVSGGTLELALDLAAATPPPPPLLLARAG